MIDFRKTAEEVDEVIRALESRDVSGFAVKCRGLVADLRGSRVLDFLAEPIEPFIPDMVEWRLEESLLVEEFREYLRMVKAVLMEIMEEEAE